MAKIRRSPVEVGSLSYYFLDFIHPRWLFRISEPSTVWQLVLELPLMNLKQIGTQILCPLTTLQCNQTFESIRLLYRFIRAWNMERGKG